MPQSSSKPPPSWPPILEQRYDKRGERRREVAVTAADTTPQIDPAEVLAARGHERATEIERIKGGWATLIWRFRGADGDLRSLRVYRLANRERAAEVEMAALRHLESVGFPAPRVESVSAIDDLPAAVLTWVPGYPLLANMEQRPWRIRSLARSMGATQARLHSCPPPPDLVEGAPQSWMRLIEPGYEHLIDDLLRLEPASSAFIHMDFHPLNVLSDGHAITGVVDWAGACAGDPRADLARTEITLETAPAPPGPLKPIVVVLRRLIMRWWLQGYEEAAGQLPDYKPFRRWAAAGLLREVNRVMGHPEVWAGPAYAEVLRRLADK